MVNGPFSRSAGDAVDYAVKLVTSVNTEKFSGATATRLRQFTADSMMISDNLNNNLDTMDTRIREYKDRAKLLAKLAVENNVTEEERKKDETTLTSLQAFATDSTGDDTTPAPQSWEMRFGGESVIINQGTPRSEVKAQKDRMEVLSGNKIRYWDKLSDDFTTMHDDLETAIGGIPSEDWIKTYNNGVRPPLDNSLVLAHSQVQRKSDFLSTDFQSGALGTPPLVGGKTMYEFSQNPVPVTEEKKTSNTQGNTNNSSGSSNNSSSGSSNNSSSGSSGGSSGSSGSNLSGRNTATTGGDLGAPPGRSSLSSGSNSTSNGGADAILDALANSNPKTSSNTETGLSSFMPGATVTPGMMPAAGVPGAAGYTGMPQNNQGLTTPNNMNNSLLGAPGNNLTQLSKADLERMLNNNSPSNLSSRSDTSPNVRSSSDNMHNTSRNAAERGKATDQVIAAPTPIAPGMGGMGRAMPGMPGAPGAGGMHGGMGPGMGPGMMGGAGAGGGKKDGKKIQSQEKDILGSDISSVAPVINASGGSNLVNKDGEDKP